jgi:hypothetical protein
MPELSSCYFCGTALDTPAEKTPVVPPALDSDDDHEVALCSTCRRKLEGILELVLAAVDDGGDVDAILGEDRVGTSDGPGAADATEAAEWTTDAAGGSDDHDREERDRAADDVAEDSADAEDDQTDDPSADAEDSADAEERSDAEAGSEATPFGEPSSGDDEEATDGTTEASGEDDAPEILSSGPAKKVIRLLQNREFPVERGEFEVVASNAYDIQMTDCKETIDALVEEGYVDERDGDLHRPDE